MSDTTIDILIKGKHEAKEALTGATADVTGLGDAGDKVTKPGGGLGGMVSMLGGPAGIAAGAAGAALVGVGVAAFDMAQDMDAAMKSVQSQLGLTEEEAAGLKPAIEDLFVSGLVGSATEGADAIAEARRQLKGMSDEELGGAAQSVLRLSNTFGEDYGKTLNTINTLQTQFGLTFEEAANFVTTGFQKGLNSSGDFLDSVGEYSTQFSNGGADAGQFFSVLETGLQGGVLGTDKAADAFKEFGLRVADGSDSSKEALAGIGINADELWGKMATGEVTTADAFQEVLAGLNKIEDPIKRNAIGVALIGTQYEDMGASGVLGMNLAQTSLEDMAGATDELTSQTSSLGSEWESTKRELLLALGPLGEEFLKLAKEYMPEVKAAGLWLADFLRENLPGAIQNTKTFFADLNRGIGVVQGVFQDASRGAEYLSYKIQELKNWLSGLDDDLPDWLRPGSPTPFEIGLGGIAREMGDLARNELPSFRAGLALDEPLLPDLGTVGATAGGGASGGVVIQNLNLTVQGSVLAEADFYRQAARGLRDALNEDARISGRANI